MAKSMSEEQKEVFFKEKLDEIFTENEIRFAGFIDPDGNLIKGKIRKDIIPFENDEEQRKIFRELAIRVATRVKFDYSMGRVKYSASRREKLVMMSFPLKKVILLITAEPNVNIDRLAYKIIQILGKEWSEFFGK
ncbi:DUF6659 family protein [Nitrosopumilus sp. K4]|uniref:DUF6659 family protein n=1 Tax=Nitrosopumilus sp. K4 TaxID=2795383 RepID=UPI0035300342